MMKFSKRKDGNKDKKKRQSRKEMKKLSAAENDIVPIFPAATVDLKRLLEYQGCNLKPKESTNRTSRLSPSLYEMLKTPSTLGYFMEFLDSKDLKHLVDFWIAVETFGVVAGERCSFDFNHSQSSSLQSKTDIKFIPSDKNVTEISSDFGLDKTDLRKQANLSHCSDCQILQKSQINAKLKAGISSNRINASKVVEDTSSSLLNGFCERDKGVLLSGGSHSNNEDNSESKTAKCSNGEGGHLLTNDWQPFAIDDNKSERKSSSENYKYSRKNSYMAKRIMSKQTRSRTRSAVIDAVGIYARYMSLDADEPISIPSHMRNAIEAGICRNKESVSPECFLPAQKFVFANLETLHEEFLGSTFGNKYKLFVLRETRLKLEDVIYNDHSLFYFMEYLDRENFKEIIEFWLMTENFEQNIIRKTRSGTYDLNEAVEDAMSVYEKYFSMRAKHQIIEDDKLRIVIENNICREDGPQSNCFCIPVAYAWTALKEIFFPRFLKSDAFAQLLESFFKNSINFVKSDEVSSTTSSDSRSESQELLPSAASFSDFLDHDTEDLWYRPDAGRLAMGYVNQYGVFITDMESAESEDDKGKNSSVSKLGKAMKNLLSKESDEDKERLAWEKARSIIEDIQRQSK